MNELIAALIGFVVPFVVGWLLAKLRPDVIAKWLSNSLSKVLKDEKSLDKVEDEIGKKLVEIGMAIINKHKIGDEPAVNP